ncbi:C39 family peptidase [Vibrio sp. ZSDZ65]|uniref:C39 family peptidase n=1 Tax=Vibrio qingdaonensis TaxID=2829491 RepID=A0A9X3HYK2_9VIBR|nr:C39 family peptidase [Vibrio qingdaonensis]MCW8347917.1 C39 family peptidase [Vibrio qingdaonensis]
MKATLVLPFIIVLLVLTSCKSNIPKQVFYSSQSAMGKPAFEKTETRVRLNIPNLNWDKYTRGVRSVGWCGEASLQMIALYYGYYYSQKTINEAGSPKKLDLYSDEISIAMNKLGFKYSTYINYSTENVNDYLVWMKESMKKGFPVFSGVKRNPSGNPNWSLDHFVVLVGFSEGYITYNSNNQRYGQVRVEASTFMGSSQPYGLENKFNHYFGFSISGVEINNIEETNNNPIRLFILGETKDKVDIGLKIENLIVGREYSIMRKTIDLGSKLHSEVLIKTFVAFSNSSSFSESNLNKHDSFHYELLLKK